MRATLLLAAGAVLSACAGAPAERASELPAPGAIALRNPGFEAPARAGERCPEAWLCTMHADPDSFRFFADASSPGQGTRSGCIERVTPEPWAVMSQPVPAQSLRGRKLRFSIAIRGERLAGQGGGPWLLVHGPAGVLLHKESVSLVGSRWERRSIEVDVPAQAQEVEVGVTLVGAGRICIDDARLEPV